MHAGPKRAADPSVLPFECDAQGAERFAAWCEAFLIVPKGKGAGEPMRLRPWQVDNVGFDIDPSNSSDIRSTRAKCNASASSIETNFARSI